MFPILKKAQKIGFSIECQELVSCKEVKFKILLGHLLLFFQYSSHFCTDNRLRQCSLSNRWVWTMDNTLDTIKLLVMTSEGRKFRIWNVSTETTKMCRYHVWKRKRMRNLDSQYWCLICMFFPAVYVIEVHIKLYLSE